MPKKKNTVNFERYKIPKNKDNLNRTARYVAIGAVFLVICAFYMVKLIGIQLEGSKSEQPSDGNVIRTYTVSGKRGEICDRNGTVLVGNKSTYSVVFEYGAIPDTTAEFNRSILAALRAIDDTGNTKCLADDLYVLEGTYPNLRYTDAAYDTGSDEFQGLLKILHSNKLSVADTTAKDLTSALVRKYKLYSDYYTDDEITALLRVRYEMERVGFGLYQSYTLARNVSVGLMSYMEESGIDGINFVTESERVYHYPGYASHILGRLGKIQAEDVDYYTGLGYSLDAYVGVSGCEQAFEGFLHGQDGILAVEYDKDGNVVDKYYEVEPISGSDVWLTIDIDLQIAAEDGLRETISGIESSQAGASVAIDPNNGDILAIASYPTFDITRTSDPDYYESIRNNELSPELNRAVSGVYAPGSTYKVGVALAALEEGNITQSTTYTCNHVFPELHRPTCLGNHGPITVADAIKVSCNIFFYYVGLDMGTDNITKYTSRLGLGVSTGIEIPERTGLVAGRENRPDWNSGDDISAAIGQSDHGYTPLQIGVYMSSIVNGGTRYAAHLLSSVHGFYNGEIIYESKATVLDSVEFSESTYSTLMSAMRSVITYSGNNLSGYFSDIPAVAGKTGTAEVGGKKDYALFMGCAPYDDPEIVAVCVLEQGVRGTYAAGPVSRIFREYFKAEE